MPIFCQYYYYISNTGILVQQFGNIGLLLKGDNTEITLWRPIKNHPLFYIFKSFPYCILTLRFLFVLQIKEFWRQLSWPDPAGSFTFVTKVIEVRLAFYFLSLSSDSCTIMLLLFCCTRANLFSTDEESWDVFQSETFVTSFLHLSDSVNL